MNKLLFALIILNLSPLPGCNGNRDDTYPPLIRIVPTNGTPINPLLNQDLSDSVSAVGAALAGAANTGNTNVTSTLAFLKQSKNQNIAKQLKKLNNLLTSPAYATIPNNCNNTVATLSCNNGEKSITFNACDVASTGQNYSGSETLNWSTTTNQPNPNCDITQLNQTVTRTLNMTRSNVANETIQTTSATETNYLKIGLGGGTVITNIGTEAMQLDILGINKIATNQSTQNIDYNISIATSAPISIIFNNSGTGQLDGTKTLDGGVIVVNHNLTLYTAEFTPKALYYNNSECCHPSSGEVDINYTLGSYAGTTAKFLYSSAVCGEVLYTKGALTKTIQLHGCE